MGGSANVRGQNQAATTGAKVTATNSITRTVQLYQKALRIFHNIHDKYESLTELIDILSFDPRSIKALVTQLTANGMNSALDVGPTVVMRASLKFPRAMMKKMQSVWKFMFRMGLGHSKVQEFLGELATGVIVQALGYELPQLTLDAVHGPDQVARHPGTGTWGIFEAKGGKAKLGTKSTSMGGPQMSPKWITGWIKNLIAKNAGSEYGRKLKKSFGRGDVMLAAVTRLRVFNKAGGKIGAEFEVAAQKYEADDEGRNMKPWGAGW